jgi:hypothetical protein
MSTTKATLPLGAPSAQQPHQQHQHKGATAAEKKKKQKQKQKRKRKKKKRGVPVTASRRTTGTRPRAIEAVLHLGEIMPGTDAIDDLQTGCGSHRRNRMVRVPAIT